MIILDTNLISEAAKPVMDPQVRRWFVTRALSGLYATSVSLAEISLGIEKLPDSRRKEALRENMDFVFHTYFADRILPFDEHAARAYGRLVAAGRAKGHSILMADGQIAAIAEVHGFTVATRDTAPFEAAGIPVINPWAL